MLPLERPLFPDLIDDVSPLSMIESVLRPVTEPLGLSDLELPGIFDLNALKDLELPCVSDFAKEGSDCKAGPPRSKEVVEALFLGVDAPEPFDSAFPMFSPASSQSFFE